ncbi:MAG TPA: MmcQ/YjbR family DNA-binding protein [Candidatus Dormibacteraeota bacterium]
MTPKSAVATTGDIRRWATALPEVEESSHFIFDAPVFKVRGRSFLGISRGERTVVFLISERDANQAQEADPDSCRAVRRQDARRSFLGLEVVLEAVSKKRIEALVEQAWLERAPKRLAKSRRPG